jgi:hypothetical protein
MKMADRRAGSIVAALYNVHTRQEETDPVREWDDFFTEWKGPAKEVEEQTEEEMFEIMKTFAAAHPEGLSN